MQNLILTTLLLAYSLILIGQDKLSLTEIMKGDDFIGHQPNNIRWTHNGAQLLFDWKRNDTLRTYAYDMKKKSYQQLPSSTILGEYDASITHRNFFFVHRGNLYYQPVQGEAQQVIQTSDQIKELQHVNQEGVCYYRINQQLFQFDKNKGQLKEIIAFVKKSKEQPSTTDFLSRQEEMLFEYIQPESPSQEVVKFKEVNIGEKSVGFMTISPDEKMLFFRLSENKQYTATKFMSFIERNGYAKEKYARPKVGSEKTLYELGIYLKERDSLFYADFSFLSGLRQRPAYQAEYGFTQPLTEDKLLIMHEPVFNSSGTQALISVKSQDNKDRWIVLFDLQTSALTELVHQHDEAWIGGPGIYGWNAARGTLGWFLDDQHIYFQNEETGYSHLYRMNVNSKKTEALTSGNYEVHGVHLSKDGQSFFLTTNSSHPGDRNFYRLNWKTKELTSITNQSGHHQVIISPDEKNLAIRFSAKNKPWELYLAKNVKETSLTQLTHSTTDEFKAYKWYKPEVITFKAADGATVHARIYEPREAIKNGAAVIFVHGAGYLQNAHNWWSTYHREYMFHNLLIEKGFTVLDIDYRASEGYGRDHRTAIYRHMGGKDLSDHIDGKNWLVAAKGIDPNRVGIYGGSYGGFITLMALLTTPDEFKVGGALRSVTDWAHYNHGYTSNILNTPEEDSIAYQRSSPIYFAEGLTKKLIMFHGMVDDNVQYQDVVRLSQRFIELGKKNWDLVSYPIEPHGFKTTSSWVDEYRRLLELFEENLTY